MKIIPVACAIIEKDDHFLAVQRSASMTHPLKWEFPGGKIENYESALLREILEELSIHTEIIRPLPIVTHTYTHACIELHPFVTKIVKGELTLTEHQSFAWLDKGSVGDVDWLEADIDILRSYLKQ